MPGPVFLEGDVVELRTTEPEDVEFLQQLINDPRVRLNIGSTDPINGPEERELVESIGDRDGFHWTICADGDPVGTVGLHRPNEVWGTTEIGYSVAPEHWDNGYATDAIDLACRYAFQERRLHKVYANVYATNPASGRVLEKVGFTKEGELREEAFVDGERVDVYRYGLLAEEWRRSQ